MRDLSQLLDFDPESMILLGVVNLGAHTASATAKQPGSSSHGVLTTTHSSAPIADADFTASNLGTKESPASWKLSPTPEMSWLVCGHSHAREAYKRGFPLGLS